MWYASIESWLQVVTTSSLRLIAINVIVTGSDALVVTTSSLRLIAIAVVDLIHAGRES